MGQTDEAICWLRVFQIQERLSRRVSNIYSKILLSSTFSKAPHRFRILPAKEKNEFVIKQK